MISSADFYGNYYGHPVEHLDILETHLRYCHVQASKRNIIYLAGDSSADNKFWFSDRAAAVNGLVSLLYNVITIISLV